MQIMQAKLTAAYLHGITINSHTGSCGLCQPSSGIYWYIFFTASVISGSASIISCSRPGLRNMQNSLSGSFTTLNVQPGLSILSNLKVVKPCLGNNRSTMNLISCISILNGLLPFIKEPAVMWSITADTIVYHEKQKSASRTLFPIIMKHLLPGAVMLNTPAC